MIKKEKIFELKIQEDDDLSGIDSISLVDEPAIEVNWVAFKKEVQEDFHIPDGEDDTYLDKLLSKGQPEQELLDEGWEIDRIESVKENFATTPNDDSYQDNSFYRIRYKYALNSNIKQSAIIPTTRQFCRELISRNYVWRIEEVENEINSFGQSAQFWRGGFNCRHEWYRIFYKRSADIINKASVNKGKITDGDFPIELSPEWLQPDTITDKTAANPSPSTIKNLGLSKQDMGYDNILPPYVDEVSGDTISKSLVDTETFEDVNVDVYGYKTKYFQICPGAQATFLHLISMDNDDDTIGMIRSAAVVADSIFKIEADVLQSKMATQEQLKEAIVLVDDFKDIINEIDKISGMKHDVSYMDGHIETIKSYVKQNMESYSDYPDSVKNNAKAVLKYVEENGWGDCGTEVGKIRANQLAKGEAISLDTVKRMYSYLSRHEVDLESSKGYGDGCGKLMYDSWGGKSALSWAQSKINQAEKMSKQYFATDSEKHIVLGPAMIPEQKIFRKDALGNPYYVFFTAETIRMIAEKYMRNKYTDNNDTMHDGKAVKDIHVLESWIKDSEHDKSNKYGFENLPVGTWFVSMKVNNPKVWEDVKEGKLNGFSVSGYFEEVSAFTKEEMFLYKVAEVLKNIKD